jgi:hypothetical protein
LPKNREAPGKGASQFSLYGEAPFIASDGSTTLDRIKSAQSIGLDWGKMTIADSDVRRFSMGRVIKRAFDAIASNLLTFALLSLFTAIPSAALSWLDPQFADLFQFDILTIGLYVIAWLAYLISAFVLQAAVVHGTFVDLNGKRASVLECLSTGLRHFLPLIAIALIYAVWVVLGLIMAVVPGVVFAVMMSVAVPVRVVERTEVLVAFDRSEDLTKGHRGAIFGLFVAYFIVQAIISEIIVSIVGLSFMTAQTLEGAASTDAGASALLVILASTVAAMVNAVLTAAGTAAIYVELRQIKECVGPEALAAVFD